MIPVFSRKNFIFLTLGIFVLLFGVASEVFAGACKDETGWRKTDFSCTINYTDLGGSNLTSCKYKLVNSGGHDTGWIPTESLAGCSGQGPVTLSVPITVGADPKYCRSQGTGTCKLFGRAVDSSGNVFETDPATPIKTFDVDYSPPSGGSISYLNAFTNATSVVLAVSDGTETGSGINTLTRTVQRESATLSGGSCGTYGSFATVSVTGTYPSFTNSGLASGNCYQYQYLVQDNAGNEVVYTSSSVVKVDTVKPDIHVFDVVPKIPAWANAATANVAVSFDVSDAGGSALKDVEVWRENPAGHTPVGWNKIGTVLASSLTLKSGSTAIYQGSYQDSASSLQDAKTYRYGIHVNDNAGNMRDENDNTPTDPYTGGSLSVQVDKTAPIVTINQAAGQADPTNASPINFTAVFSESVSGFTSSDVTIGGTAGGTKTIAVTGSGATYTIAVSGMTDGTVTASIAASKATDAAGNNNTASTSTDNTVTYDVTAPNTAISSNPPNPTNSTSASFSFTSFETGSTFQCEIDAGGFSSCTSPESYTSLIQASHTFKVRATDAAGNTDATPASYTWTIDTAAPAITSTAPAANAFINSQRASYTLSEAVASASVVFTRTSGTADSSSPHTCNLQGTALSIGAHTNLTLQANSNACASWTNLVSGTVYTVTFNAADPAGNSATPVANTSVTYDTAAPRVDVFKVNNKTYPNPPTVNVNGSFPITWMASDTGGAGIQRYEVWRAWDANGNGTLQGSEWNDSSPSSGTQANPIYTGSSPAADNPPDGTYWYGVHVIDNANNCITEDTTFCPGGVTSDSTTRTVRGPIKVRMQHNSSPTIQGNVEISPAPPVKAGVALTFSVDWNDQDAQEQVKIHICKDAISGSSCNAQGSWCASTSFTTNDPVTCSYTILATDGGTKTYNAYACDDEGACSSAKSGTFLVDITAPTITTFAITPESPSWANNASPSVTITWNVSDQGESHLDRVKAELAPFDNTDPDGDGKRCNDVNKEDCAWSQAGSDAVAPNNADNWNCGASCNSRIIHESGSGTWWYRIRVFDKAQNETFASSPRKALVDKDEPNSQIQSPASSSWFSSDFNLDTMDEDLHSGLDATQCQYKIIPFEDTNGDGTADTERPSSGWLLRTCNAPPSAPVTAITVGSADYCKYQAKSSCWVYVRSKDVAGNWHTPTQPAGSVKLYNVDWTQPQPGKLYLTANEGDQVYPIQVQLDRSNTYNVHVTDNLKVSGCSLYIDGIDQGVMTPTVPGCETECTFTKDFTFTGTGTYHNNYATCRDAANNSKSGTSVDIEVKTLSVVLSAIPSSGSVSTLFDLIATVSGTIAGNINYKFDCTNDGTWELQVNNQTQNPYTAVDLCRYASPGTHTAKVFVERGVGTTEDTASLSVSANSIPTATNLQNNNAEADYCFVSSPPIILSWQFSDPEDGSSQSAYRVQIATNPSFGSPTDTCPQGEESGTCTPGYSAQQYAPPSLAYATTYYWRVKVRDSAGDFSSPWANGPYLTTPAHPYPVPNFTWSPALPGAQELVQFCSRAGGGCPTDVTTFAPGSLNQSFSWNFGDPDSGANNTSALQNPTHTYAQTQAYGVTLQATDNAGSCSASQSVNVAVPFPEWQEISPF